MKKTVILFLGILFLISFRTIAQTKYNTLFFQNPLYLNPAFSGIEDGKINFNANSRYENYATPKSFKYYISSDISIGNSGIGLQFVSNRLLEGVVIEKMINASYAYNWKINDNFRIRPAIQLGMVFERIDIQKFIFQDQYLSDDGTLIQPDPLIKDNKTYGNAGLGLIFIIYDLTAGIAVDNLNSPKSLAYSTGGKGKGLNYTAHFQYKYALSEKTELKPGIIFHKYERDSRAFIEPTVTLKTHSIEIGTMVRLAGGSVKTLSGIIGYAGTNLSIHYSYDHNTAKAYYGGSAHEIALGVKI